MPTTSLSNKGNDLSIIRELFSHRDDLEFQEITTLFDEIKNVKIERVLYQYKNQALIVRVREGKKVSITQLIIKNRDDGK